MNDDLTGKQLEREKECQAAGYKTFLKNDLDNKKFSNGSSTVFGLMVKKHLLQYIIKALQDKIKATLGYNKAEINQALTGLIGADEDGSTHALFDITEAAFIGLQLTLVTALNPTTMEGQKQLGRAGGDKKLLVKKTVPQLQTKIGEAIHKQIQLKIIQRTFPEFFRKANHWSRKPHDDGATASTAYWEYNLFRSIKRYADKLREEGDLAGAKIIDECKQWGYREESIIGSLVLSCVLTACQDYITTQHGSRNGKRSKEIVLTSEGKLRQQEMLEYASTYSHDLLPMLVEPIPVTNENLGGWLSDSLQENEYTFNGDITLSDRHLEFINRQARQRFQINPFTQKLMEELCEREWELGKFHFQRMEAPLSIANELGYAHLKGVEQDKAVRSDKRTKALRQRNSAIYSRNTKKLKDGLLSYSVQSKASKVINDDAFYIPMKYDFRGRIYSRVPFVSFQSNECGRYLIRFADHTAVDDRTEHWLKIGISNAGGNDKLCWQKRLQWVEENLDEIINVGKMLDDGDFNQAYRFLTLDCIDEPFALAALANEFVKVFIDKVQDYTQVFVTVDASCSGTSIFNAWRENLSGAEMTNLVDTPAPADIYSEVWEEIKRMVPEGTFRPTHIKRLEKLKLARKMCKQAYVPAQYASPIGEQKHNLKLFNKDLEKKNLHFNEEELKILCDTWVEALDKVSSINTVIRWFRSRTKEALAANDEINYTTCNGSRMTLKYPQSKLERVQVFGLGGTEFKQQRENKPTDKVDKKKMLNGVTANITHATDAAALCEALWNWEVTPFIAIHDACGIPASRHLDDAVTRLKEGFVTATQHNVWDTFRDDNGIDKTPLNAGPVIGDLKDWSLVLKSKYLYS